MSDAPNSPQISPLESPLQESDPNSLDELFKRIDEKLVLGLPREISEFEIERVVSYYLRERERFIYEQAHNIKPTRGKSGLSKAEIIKVATDELDIF